MSTKEPSKPTKKDLLTELEDIKMSLEREVFGDLLGENPQTNDTTAPPVDTSPSAQPSPQPAESGELAASELSTLALPEEETRSDMDKVIEEEQSAPHDASAKASPPAKSAKTANSSQQSLFDAPGAGETSRQKNTPQPRKNPTTVITPVTDKKNTENPFLPAHIRERLSRNQEQSVIQDLVQVGDALSRQEARAESTMLTAGLSDDEKLLIDAVVAKYLPEIERELRRKLAEQLVKNPVTP